MELGNLLSLFGGLALFLYGMKMMGDGLELAAGAKLQGLLERLTHNRFWGMVTGLVITAVIQSSSATTVMVVGFVNAGMMNLKQAIGVIMGANIGTTVTGQLIALDVGMIAPLMALVGVVLMLFFKQKRLQHIGQVLAGLGILFIGMNTMSSAMKPLRDVPYFQQLMVSFQNPLIGVLVGTAFTAIIQSSSASIGILQALASQGLIGLDGAVFVLFGMNIGTCVTSLLSSIGTSRNARRTALVHILFNVIGALLFILITLYTPFVHWMEQLTPSNAMAQIANAHTTFNVVTTLLLLPCANLLGRLATRIIPGEDPTPEKPRLQFIDDRVLGATSIGVRQVSQEIDRMQQLASGNLQLAMQAFFTGDVSRLPILAKNEEVIDFLNKEITRFLVKLNSYEMTEEEAQALGALYHVTSDVERIGDHAENIGEYAVSCQERGTKFSPEAMAELKELDGRVHRLLQECYQAFHDEENGLMALNGIERQEEDIDECTRAYQRNHVARLQSAQCSPETGMLFVEILTDLERVADHALNIAQARSRQAAQ